MLQKERPEKIAEKLSEVYLLTADSNKFYGLATLGLDVVHGALKVSSPHVQACSIVSWLLVLVQVTVGSQPTEPGSSIMP